MPSDMGWTEYCRSMEELALAEAAGSVLRQLERLDGNCCLYWQLEGLDGEVMGYMTNRGLATFDPETDLLTATDAGKGFGRSL